MILSLSCVYTNKQNLFQLQSPSKALFKMKWEQDDFVKEEVNT